MDLIQRLLSLEISLMILSLWLAYQREYYKTHRLQDPSQDSMRSPTVQCLQNTGYSSLSSEYGDSPVRKAPPPRTSPPRSPPTLPSPVIRSRPQNSPLDYRRVESPDISSVRLQQPQKTKRTRASAATAAAPPCSESWVASATSAAEAYYQVETK